MASGEAYCDDGQKRPVTVDERGYTCGGVTLPRVSSILDVYPIAYYNQRALRVGTLVHEMIEAALIGLTIEPPSDLDKASMAQVLLSSAHFAMWWQEKGHRISHIYRDDEPLIEATMFSERLGFAGTADLICTVDGTATIIDWKTGDFYRKKYATQLVAYAALAKQTLGITVEHAAAARFEKSQKRIDEKGAPPYEAFHVARKHFGPLWSMLEHMKGIREQTLILERQGLRL